MQKGLNKQCAVQQTPTYKYIFIFPNILPETVASF